MTEDEQDRMDVERCLGGDANAFEGIVARYERPVYNAIVRMGADREEARDICQGAFLRAFQGLASYDASRRFFSWIYRVAMNEAINQMKVRRAWDPLAKDLAWDHANPEEEMTHGEIEDEIKRALLRLEMNDRLAIIVRHFLQLSYEEGAHVLSIPEKTFKSRLFAARQRLRMILENGRHAARR